MVAAEAGHMAPVKLLLELGCDVNHLSSKGETPLYTAVSSYGKSSDVVHALLEGGANVAGHFATPLLVEGTALSAKTVQELIDAGAPLDAMILAQAFFAACESGREDAKEVVSIFIKAGADPLTLKDSDGRNALMLAAEASNMELIQLFLDMKLDLEVTDNEGHTALHAAVSRRQHLPSVKLLLDAKAKVTPAVLVAGCCGDWDLFHLLMEHGGDKVFATARDKGRAPIHELCDSRSYGEDHDDMILLLKRFLELGANVTDHVPKTDSWTPEETCLSLACRSQMPVSFIELLLEEGAAADVNFSVGRYGPPLFSACRQGEYLAVCKTLIEKGGANVQATDEEGETALMALCDSRDTSPESIELFRYLVKLGVDPRAKASSGAQAIHKAASR
jgi:ankyrin repeat protein